MNKTIEWQKANAEKEEEEEEEEERKNPTTAELNEMK